MSRRREATVQWSSRWSRAWIERVLLGILYGLSVGPAAPSAVAQITYSIFPVKNGNVADATLREAVPQPGQNGKGALVTLAVSGSTLDNVVETLAHQAHLLPVYDRGNSVFARRVTVHLVDIPVMEAFVTVLKGTGLVATLRPDQTTVMIGTGGAVPRLQAARRAPGIIVGRVTDSASGQGLGGAAVKVEGTKLTTVTSDSGRFTLRDVPAGEQVITVKLFGYRPAERTVTVVDSQSTTVRLSLVSIPTVLSGVVTTATGMQRKIEVGNDITTLNVDSIRQVTPISSFTDLLEGRVPGLTVLHSSGVPGDPSRLRLRGAGSIEGNNDPVIIVDGIRVYGNQSDPRNQNLAPVFSPYKNTIAKNLNTGSFAAPSPVDQIDVADIEKVEVLKDPSATAIYGSDAAAGVIVITTKHGRAGPTRWTLNVSDGVNWMPGSWPTTYYRFGQDTAFAGGSFGLCSWSLATCRTDSVVAFQALNDPRYTVFGHGSNQTVDLSVSGGVPALTYNLTGSGAGNIGYLHLPVIEQQRYDSVYGSQFGKIPHDLVQPDHYTTWGVSGSLDARP